MKRLAELKGRGNDYVVIVLAVLLITFGMAMLSSASSHVSQLKTGDTLYYVRHQLMYGVLPGIALFFLLSNIYYKRYEKMAALGMALGITLLILTLTPLAVIQGGAARWIQIGPLTFQPSEPLKLLFILYLAAWLSAAHRHNRHTTGGFVAFLIILGTVIGLLLKQPATSTALLISAIAIIMYFINGSRISHLVITTGLICAGLITILFIVPQIQNATKTADATIKIDYRVNRIQAFLHPERTAQTSGYQVSQGKMAIGSGGFWGVGYGQSTTKINSLPEPLGDSIFAVMGEELGFMGSLLVIGLILGLVVRIFIIAQETRDRFGHLILMGFGSLIAIQSFVNIGAISGLLPSTGIALPFVSYGSSALIVFMGIIGIINNISKHSD